MWLIGKVGNVESIVDIAKALSDSNREKIVMLLLHKDYCVRSLAEQIGIREASVSQHLQILRKAGIVKGEKRGYWTHYSVQPDALEEAALFLQSLSDRARNFKPCCNPEEMNCHKGGE